VLRFLSCVPSSRTGGQFLRLVDAIGLAVRGSIKQLTAFGYAGSEVRRRVRRFGEYAIPASGNWSEIKERAPARALSGQEGDATLRPYAGLVAALAIGIHSNGVLVASSGTKAEGIYCGLGLPETFSTCGPGIYLCRLCR